MISFVFLNLNILNLLSQLRFPLSLRFLLFNIKYLNIFIEKLRNKTIYTTPNTVKGQMYVYTIYTI